MQGLLALLRVGCWLVGDARDAVLQRERFTQGVDDTMADDPPSRDIDDIEMVRRPGTELRCEVRLVADDEWGVVPEVRCSVESQSPDRRARRRVDCLVVSVAVRVVLGNARLHEQVAVVPDERHTEDEPLNLLRPDRLTGARPKPE